MTTVVSEVLMNDGSMATVPGAKPMKEAGVVSRRTIESTVRHCGSRVMTGAGRGSLCPEATSNPTLIGMGVSR